MGNRANQHKEKNIRGLYGKVPAGLLPQKLKIINPDLVLETLSSKLNRIHSDQSLSSAEKRRQIRAVMGHGTDNQTFSASDMPVRSLLGTAGGAYLGKSLAPEDSGLGRKILYGSILALIGGGLAKMIPNIYPSMKDTSE